MGYETDLRNLYQPQYYNGLYTPQSASFFNSGLLSPPPPTVSSPSSLMGFNSLSRSLLGNQSTSLFNPNNSYLPSTSGQAATSNNSYPLLNNAAALSMYGGLGYNAAAGASSSASKTTNNTMFPENMLNFLQNSYMNSSSSARPTNTPSPLGQPMQGPNAKRNPMLSKELSIPSLMPPRNAHYEALNLPSIPTSVIKSSTNASSTTETSTTATTTMPTVTSTTSSIRKRRQSCGGPLKNDNSPMPEPHIIVKNVNSINKQLKQHSAQDSIGNKTTAALEAAPGTKDDLALKSYGRHGHGNIGIVYPDKTGEVRKSPLTAQPVVNMGIVYPGNKKEVTNNQSMLRNKNTTTNSTLPTASRNVHSMQSIIHIYSLCNINF